MGGVTLITAVMVTMHHEADAHLMSERVDGGKPVPIRCRCLMAHQDVGPDRPQRLVILREDRRPCRARQPALEPIRAGGDFDHVAPGAEFGGIIISAAELGIPNLGAINPAQPRDGAPVFWRQTNIPALVAIVSLTKPLLWKLDSPFFELEILVGAYSDEAGHAFRFEAGHLFRFHSGHLSDLKSDT